MNSVTSRVKPQANGASRGSDILRLVLREVAGVALIAAVSVGTGLVINRFLSRPLPMVYQTPEQRLKIELAQLIAAPAFQSMPVEMIDLPEFRKAIDTKQARILDARSSTFYRQGHVPGAVNLARDNFAADYIRLHSTIEKSRDSRVIVYCSGGECRDSKMVAQALMSLGFTNVAVFSGGWEEWTAAHLPEAQG